MPATPRSPQSAAASLAAAALLATTACGGTPAADPDALAMRIDTLGDTISVHIASGSVWGDTAMLVPEVAIGMADGPDEYLLGQIASLAAAPTGEIYLMDRQVPALRKYGADGSYLMTLGREGSGPGEYRRPDGGLTVLSDGRVVLRDPGNSRFSIYAPDGSSLGQWSGLSGGFNTSNALVRGTDDAVHTFVLLETDLPPWQWVYGMARYDATGQPGDTVAAPTYDFERPMIRGQREGNSSSSGVPFAPDQHWAMLPSRAMVSGLATSYSFTIAGPDGVRRITREGWTPVPVQPEEGEEQERRATDNMRRNFPGWTWNGPPIPGTKPAYTDLSGAEDGRVWVQVPTLGEPYRTAAEAAAAEVESERPELRFRERVAFDVYEPDGRFLGHVRTPEGFRTSPQPVFRGDNVWAVADDPETGIPQLVRYRLAR
jgi:hypothetical protein